MSEGAKLPVQARLKSSGLSIGDLARRSGVRASAIRYYEECGLLPTPPRRSGQRFYDHDAIERLKAILAARALGFSIRDISRLSKFDIRAQQKAARAKAKSLRKMIDQMETNAVRLDALTSCPCASTGIACRL